MIEEYIIPNWFFGFDIGMEVLFALITMLVSVVAFKIARVTKERKVNLFGVAFLLISLSYIVWAGINLWFTQLVSEDLRELSIQSIAVIGVLGLYAYMLLFTSGLVNLVSTTCEAYRGKAYYLIFGLSLLVVVSSLNKLITFRILAVFLLSFVAYHYFEEYFKNKNKKTLYAAWAFTLLLLSSIDFIFLSYYYYAYIIGHLLELSAYLLFLYTLAKSMKK